MQRSAGSLIVASSVTPLAAARRLGPIDGRDTH